MNKIIVIIIISVILSGFLFWAFQSGFIAKFFGGPIEQIPIPEGIILFYGQGCFHCKNVEDFLVQNKIEDKIKFTRLEAWYNKDNQVILSEVAPKCGITSGTVGVPLLYDGNNKCFSGDVDVINFFKTQAGIK